jgi:hypothetical protein
MTVSYHVLENGAWVGRQNEDREIMLDFESGTSFGFGHEFHNLLTKAAFGVKVD